MNLIRPVAVALACLVVSTGCAATYKRTPTIPEVNRPELWALPEHPETKDLSEFPGGEAEVAPLEENDPAPFSGILDSERHAARDLVYRESYKELLTHYESSRKAVGAQRELYETLLDQADAQIQTLQPSWWEDHDAEVVGIGAFVLGIVVTVSVVEALSPNDGATK